jgi:antitoxin VapB
MASKAHRPTPRRQQRGVTIRSDHALARLALLTRDGRSQAEVIEEALDRLPLPNTPGDLETFRRKVDAILAGVDPAAIPTMTEFDAATYDENGLPR